ncbi:MAG: succinate dehydrogenase, cytochrome b556 subunit [Alphaproteobacteria bacterium]|jgi:succinate dehydrogenase / fumarate reductase, cytochrome b subunit|nr:succinate dehydrogenase, cytochrome b556 subunit [Alphaproteobacteria bacterium]
MTEKARPLSPHLSIYKPQISSVLSILHRLTGFFLYLGLLLASWNIIFMSIDAGKISAYFVGISTLFISSIVGKLVLFAWVFSLYYHFSNGIRHLLWDTGRGFAIRSVQITGIIVVLASFALTLFTWFNGMSTILG